MAVAERAAQDRSAGHVMRERSVDNGLVQGSVGVLFALPKVDTQKCCCGFG